MSDPLLVGLDINFGSIGWAVLDSKDPGEPGLILSHGTWVFEAPMDPKSGTSLLKERGEARRARRTRDRKRRRMAELRRLLEESGMLPTDVETRDRLLHEHVRYEDGAIVENHPYALRSRGLKEPLTLHELGRAILHLSIRRAYLDVGDLKWLKLARSRPDLARDIRSKSLKSARKLDEKAEPDKERRQVLGAIKRIEQLLEGRTPGEFFAELVSRGERVRFDKSAKDPNKQGFLLSRWMLEDEFRRIWDAQKQYWPAVLSDSLFAQLDLCMFDQRGLPPQRHLRNQCAVFTSHGAAAKASIWFQRFRIAQDLVNMRVHVDGDVQPLTRHQRELLFDVLQTTPHLSATQAKKALATAGCPVSVRAGLVYAAGDDEKVELKGNESAARVRALLGTKWDALETPDNFRGSEGRQRCNQANLVQDLIDLEPMPLYDRLTSFWGYDRDTALALMKLKLPEGYGRYCSRLLRRTMPLMLAEGLDTQAAIDAIRGKPLTSTGEVLGASAEKWERVQSYASSEEADLAKMRNHIVARCLRECRWLLRQIETKYGRKIEVVRIEVARDFGRSAEERKDVERKQTANRKERERLKAELRASGVSDSKTNVLKLRLLKEQAECFPMYGPPCAAPHIKDIDACEIDHIIPRSRGGEPVYFDNLVLTTPELNREKGDRTAFEAWGDDPDRWALVEHNARKLGEMRGGKAPVPKARRILSTDIKDFVGDDFHYRALNDVRYATKEIMDVLRLAGYKVETVPGRTTAALRDEFRRLDVFYRSQYPPAIHGEESDDAAKDAKSKPDKNRDFHLHHALDALTVAMCDRSTLNRYLDHMRALELHQTQRMVEIDDGGKRRRMPAAIGWPRKVYEQLQAGAPPIAIGVRSAKPFAGSWTKDTHVNFAHAKVKVNKKTGKDETISAWSDEQMRELVASLKAYLDEAKRARKPYRRAAPALGGAFQVFFELGSDGQPRLTQIFPKEGNHHMTVWERGSEVRVSVASTLEVAHRWRVGRGAYDEAPPERGFKVRMTLHPGDVVELDEPGRYYVVRSVSSGTQVEVALSAVKLSRLERTIDKLYVTDGKRLYVRITTTANLERIMRRVSLDPFGVATTLPSVGD